MAANGVNKNEMEDCDEEKVVTMMDVLQEQQDFEDDANAVLGASDDKNCTYLKGYIKRQALFACLSCCNEAKTDETKRAGVCLACSLNCHENHELIELYTKRNFRCDCGNPKFNSHPCQFTPNKTDLNEDNKYNQNFSGLYCVCQRPYPDPEASEEVEMIQCIVCEDWLHSTHLDTTVPSSDQYTEMICKMCMDKNEFLHDYSSFAICNDEVDVLDCADENLSENNMSDSGIIDADNTLANNTDVEMLNSDESRDINETLNKSTVGSQETKNSIIENVNSVDAKGDMDLLYNVNVHKEEAKEILNEYGDEVTEETKSEINKSSTEPLHINGINENLNNEGNNSDENKVSEPLHKNSAPVINKQTIESVDEKSNDGETSTTEEAKIETLSEKKMPCKMEEDNTNNESKVVDNVEQDEVLSEVQSKNECPALIETTTKHENDILSKLNETESSETNAMEEEVKENIQTSEYQVQNEISENSEKSTVEDDKILSVPSLDNHSERKSKEDKLTEEEPAGNDLAEQIPAVNDSTKQEPTNNDLTEQEPTDNNLTEQEPKDNDSTKQTPDNNQQQTMDVAENGTDLNGLLENEHDICEDNSHNIDKNDDNTEDTTNKNNSLQITEVTSLHTEPISNNEHEINHDHKRKHEDSSNTSSKKPKLDNEFCKRPKGVKKIFKGATFWPSNFRQKLCTCSECLSMYKDLSVLFLIDPEDTVTAYETLGKEKVNGASLSQYEKGLEALSSLDRIQQINALTEYNKMRDKLLDFLKSFKDRKEVVKEEDIKAFFAGMKPKREPDGVYFCR